MMGSSSSVIGPVGGKEVRQCWICFAEEEVELGRTGREWVRPCRCRGTTRWVHQSCLLSWLDSQVQQDSLVVAPAAKCPQCHTAYQMSEALVLPKWALVALDRARSWAEEALLYSSLGAIASGIYLVSAAYGLGTVSAVLGRAEVRRQWALLNARQGWLRAVEAMRLATGVPLVSVFVLSLRYRGLRGLQMLLPFFVYEGPASLRLRWPPPSSTLALAIPIAAELYEGLVERRLLPRLRRALLPDLAPGESAEPIDHLERPSLLSQLDSLDSVSETDDHTLKISIVDAMSTLLFPIVSAGFGWLLFGRCSRLDPWQRTVFGGLLLVLAKDAFHTLTWYQRHLTRQTRRILDHHPAP